MGCNTSKESVQPAVEEGKEGDSVKNGGERDYLWFLLIVQIVSAIII